MKLFSKILFVAAAMSAVALVSCNKDNKPSNDEPEFKAPEYVETAKKITVNNVVPTATKQVKEIEFTEAGYAIITYVKTKAETEEEVEVQPAVAFVDDDQVGVLRHAVEQEAVVDDRGHVGIDVEHVEQTADGLQEERLAAAAVALVLALGQFRVLTDGCPSLRL